VTFLVDAQLPPALARWIAHHDHTANHVEDVGLREADDAALWANASASQSIIISKDEDFVDRWLLSNKPVPLVWIRRGNCSNRALIAWLEPLWPDAVRRLEAGERLIELRT